MNMRGFSKNFASLIAAVFLLGCKPPAAMTPPEKPSVGVARPVVKEIYDWDEYTGRMAAVDAVDVRARVGGYLDGIRFKDGQIVNKGDVLFIIDPRPFNAILAAAKGDAEALSSKLALA